MFDKSFIIRSLILTLVLFIITLSFFIFLTEYTLIDFFNLKLFIIIPISIVLHEFLHAIGLFFNELSFKNITFGVSHYFIPFTRSKNKIKRNIFIISGLLPFFLLGICPIILVALQYNSFLISWIIVNIIGCSGDFILVLKK